MLRVGLNARRAGLVAVSALGAAAVLLLAAMAVLPLVVPASEVRRVAEQSLAGSTGQKAVLLGEPAIRLLPSPRVLLGKVSFPLPEGQSLDAENVVTRLNLLRLLTGTVDITDVIVERPTLVLTGPGVAPALAIAPVLAAADRPELTIVDGTIVWRTESGLTSELVSGISGSLDRIRKGRGLVIVAGLDWRDARIAVNAVIDDADAFLGGTPTPARLALARDGAQARFQGRAALGAAPMVEGALAIDVESLRDALEWAGIEPPTRGGLGTFGLNGKLSYEDAQVALTDLTLDFDGNHADGGLLLKVAAGRPLVQGTFASDTLNLTPYGALRLLSGDKAGWDRDPIDLSALDGFDLDLRLSAGRIAMGDTTFTTAAASAVLTSGRLVVALGEARAWSGLLRASLTLAPGTPEPAARATGAEVRLEAEASDVDISPALDEIGGFRRIEGIGTLQLDVAGAGTSVYDIARNLTGSASLSAASGYLAGFDVAQMLQRIERRPLSAVGDMRGGRTAFDELTGRIAISDGVGAVEEMVMRGKQAQLALTGAISIVDRTLDLAGRASLPPAKGATAGGLDLPFSVRGPWDAPRVMADPLSLIERSGAALPLLEAVKSRTGGAVEPAVDGVATPGAAPSPAN